MSVVWSSEEQARSLRDMRDYMRSRPPHVEGRLGISAQTWHQPPSLPIRRFLHGRATVNKLAKRDTRRLYDEQAELLRSCKQRISRTPRCDTSIRHRCLTITVRTPSVSTLFGE